MAGGPEVLHVHELNNSLILVLSLGTLKIRSLRIQKARVPPIASNPPALGESASTRRSFLDRSDGPLVYQGR